MKSKNKIFQEQKNLELENRLNKVRNINEHSPTKYGTTNTREWFVENFSLYYRGKEDLVAPEFLEILKVMKYFSVKKKL